MTVAGGIFTALALVVIGYRIAGPILRKAPPYYHFPDSRKMVELLDTPDGDVWPATILSNHQEGE